VYGVIGRWLQNPPGMRERRLEKTEDTERRRRFGAGVSLLSLLKGQIWREEEGIVYCAHHWHLHIGHQLVR